MSRILSISASALLAASLALPTSALAAGTSSSDPEPVSAGTRPSVSPVFSFDGQTVDDALVEGLATGDLASWSSCEDAGLDASICELMFTEVHGSSVDVFSQSSTSWFLTSDGCGAGDACVGGYHAAAWVEGELEFDRDGFEVSGTFELFAGGTAPLSVLAVDMGTYLGRIETTSSSASRSWDVFDADGNWLEDDSGIDYFDETNLDQVECDAFVDSLAAGAAPATGILATLGTVGAGWATSAGFSASIGATSASGGVASAGLAAGGLATGGVVLVVAVIGVIAVAAVNAKAERWKTAALEAGVCDFYDIDPPTPPTPPTWIFPTSNSADDCPEQSGYTDTWTTLESDADGDWVCNWTMDVQIECLEVPNGFLTECICEEEAQTPEMGLCVPAGDSPAYE